MKKWIVAGVIACLALGGRAARADEETGQLQALMTKYGSSIVTVKVVLKMSFKGAGQAQEMDNPMTVQGVVVTPDGLVMMSNMAFSATRMMEVLGAGREAAAESGNKFTPTNFKVTFGQEEKEYDAFLAATDANLDLAFAKIEGLGDRKVTPVDFSAAAAPVIGQKVIGLSRLHKGYDYASFFQSARISGEITKPRRAWVIDGGIGGLGLPVFTLTGEPVGVLSTVPSGVKEEGGEMERSLAMFRRLLTGGGGGGGAFLLPATTVKGVIDQANKRAVELAAERAKKKEEKGTGGTTKPAVPPKKTGGE